MKPTGAPERRNGAGKRPALADGAGRRTENAPAPRGPLEEEAAGSDDFAQALEIAHPDIDADAIMDRIRASIQSKRAAGLLRDEAWLARRLDAADLSGSARRGAERLGLIQMAGRLDLAGDPVKSHRPLIGWAVIACKRFTRYWIRKYTDQIFTRQTHCNAEVLQLLSELVRDNENLRERLARVERAAGVSASAEK